MINKLFKAVMVTIIIGLILLSFKVVSYVLTDSYHSTIANSNVSAISERFNKTTTTNEYGIPNPLPNVILVTFDSLSAEDMSLYGYHIRTTPNIDALATESYVFDMMIANSNWTRPSAASLIIGKYPNTHKIFYPSLSTYKMSYNHENLASVLRERGYKSAAITANGFTHPLQNLTFRDFDYLPDTIIKRSALPPIQRLFSFIPVKVRTFSVTLFLLEDILAPLNTIFIRCMPDYFTEDLFTEEYSPPDLTFTESLKFILNTKPPFFIWIHILPPHPPYLASGKFRYKLLDERVFNRQELKNFSLCTQYPPEKQHMIDKIRLRYDENIMYADDEFGNFIKVLSDKGIYGNSILIVSSDHGESFKKGYLGHGGVRLENLYQQFIWIPLIIHTPKQQIGKKISSNAEHVDIAPTVLDLLNMKVPEWMEGESLKGAMYYNQHTKKPKYSINLSPNTVNQPISKGAITVIREDYKYIYQIDENRVELYNIKNDPFELNNLVNIEGHLAEELKQLVIQKINHGGKKGH